MLKYLKIIVLFVALSPSLSTASEEQSLLATQLEKSYYKEDPNDYFEGMCPNNVNNLLNKLQKQNLNIDTYQVLYIFRRDKNNYLDGVWPQESRGWTGDGWSFHVVLNAKGWILDLDFSSQPTLVYIDEYFERMFASGQGKNQGLLLKVVPAAEFDFLYVTKFAQYAENFLKTDTDIDYPPIALEKYLKTL